MTLIMVSLLNLTELPLSLLVEKAEWIQWFKMEVLREMEEQDASPYGLSDEQLQEVERRMADFAAGRERYATDEELAALWNKCGL